LARDRIQVAFEFSRLNLTSTTGPLSVSAKAGFDAADLSIAGSAFFDDEAHQPFEINRLCHKVIGEFKSKAVIFADRNYPVLVRSIPFREVDGTDGIFRGQLEEKSSGHGKCPTTGIKIPRTAIWETMSLLRVTSHIATSYRYSAVVILRFSSFCFYSISDDLKRK
jgi:hypothetical protein